MPEIPYHLRWNCPSALSYKLENGNRHEIYQFRESVHPRVGGELGWNRVFPGMSVMEADVLAAQDDAAQGSVLDDGAPHGGEGMA